MSTQLRLSSTAFRIIFALILFAQLLVQAAPNRVLYITTSAGFRHDVLPVTVNVLRGLGVRTGLYDLVHTEDLSVINAESLKGFQGVLFFTSGELALTDAQKEALLSWIAGGGSFGGFHSATDTLYSWQRYGQMIGGYFDGHPWTQEARVVANVVANLPHPLTAGLPSPWTLTEEYYQFRDLVPEPAQVLLSLDTTSVDLNAPGVRASTFPLAWAMSYGFGRVFYTALGHFEGTWTNPDFQRLLENAMRYLLPNPALQIFTGGVGNAASMTPRDTISPGSIISIYGRNLTAGQTGGTRVLVNGLAASVLHASPGQVNAIVPASTVAKECRELLFQFCPEQRGAALQVLNALGEGARKWVRFRDATPGIFAATVQPGVVTLWMTGLGSAEFVATIGGRVARILYEGAAPGFPGLDQMNLEIPPGTPSGMQRVQLYLRPAPDPVAETTIALP